MPHLKFQTLLPAPVLTALGEVVCLSTWELGYSGTQLWNPATGFEHQTRHGMSESTALGDGFSGLTESNRAQLLRPDGRVEAGPEVQIREGQMLGPVFKHAGAWWGCEASLSDHAAPGRLLRLEQGASEEHPLPGACFTVAQHQGALWLACQGGLLCLEGGRLSLREAETFEFVAFAEDGTRVLAQGPTVRLGERPLPGQHYAIHVCGNHLATRTRDMAFIHDLSGREVQRHQARARSIVLTPTHLVLASTTRVVTAVPRQG